MFGRFEHERYLSPGEKSKRTGPVKSIATRAQTSSSLLRSDEKTYTVATAQMSQCPMSGPLSLFHKRVHIKVIKYHRWIVLDEIYQPY